MGVGTIGGMDEGPGADDESIDDEDLFDAVFGDVVEEPEPQVECEEAPIRLPSNPSDPTPEERERHNKTHVPHRSWCTTCVKARGREDKHYTAVSAERESGLAEIALDYAQIEDTVPLPDADEERDEEDIAAEQEASAPAAKLKKNVHKKRLLVGRDRWTKAVCSFLVQCKGTGDSTIVNKVVQWINALGYRKVVVKTDGEPALVEVQEAVAKARTHDTMCKNPLGYDPQANGAAERAVSEVKSQLRALKIGLEARLQSPIDARWAIMEWMIPLASDLINRYLVGADGKTAHYRIHMRNFSGMAFECGEQVMAKPVRQGNWSKLDRDPKRKLSLQSNWIEGTWVGFDSRTHEHIVVAPRGGPALRIRTVRARPASERWSLQAVREILATPDKPNPKDPSQANVRQERHTRGVKFGVAEKEASAPADTSTRTPCAPPEDSAQLPPRDFRIYDALLQKFGHTPECLGCNAKQQGTPKRMHSRTCRMRIEASLRAENPQTPALARRDERHVRWAEAEAQTAETDSGLRRGGHDDDEMPELLEEHEQTDDEAQDPFDFNTPVYSDDDGMSVEETAAQSPTAGDQSAGPAGRLRATGAVLTRLFQQSSRERGPWHLGQGTLQQR